MACVEGGYGFTRSAYYANNIFGIKIRAQNPASGWQLKEQPDENEGHVPVIASRGGMKLPGMTIGIGDSLPREKQLIIYVT
jgi:hypothetical protein